MEKYEITKDQILEIYKYGCGYVCTKLEELYPSAFKKELEVGVWYKIDKNIFCCTEISERGTLYGYGIFEGDWKERFNDGGVFCACNSFASKYRLTEATDEEVEEALLNEVIKRFGEDWETAKIEKCLVHGDTNGGFIICITNGLIWNKNGCVYNNGVFAEPLKSKVISLENELIAEAKKRGYKKGVKCVFGKAEEKRRLETDDFELSTDNELCVKRFNSMFSDIIFKNGKWAEIIPEETKVITMDKAVKILSKKYRKQVEIK